MRRLRNLPSVATLLLTCCAPASAADWPTFQHDAARSGVTPERLAAPLAPRWVFQSRFPPARGWGRPDPKMGYGIYDRGKVRYDDSFHVAVAGGIVYFASSAEDKLYAVDVATAAVRWTFHTDAPPRLAPTVADGRVYLGADDGVVYCLGARTGKLVWRFRAAPTGEMVLGQGRLMSVWPVRTGVLVDRGVAYFAAGLFPAEGLYLYAVDARSGELLWLNDHFDEGGWGSVTPQGYLLASKDKLFMPSGRNRPAKFSRADGRMLPWGRDIRLPHHTYRVADGGSYALLSGGYLYGGNAAVMCYDPEQLVTNKWGKKSAGSLVCSWFNGRRIVVAGSTAYIATDYQLLALPHKDLPAICREHGPALEAAYRKGRVHYYQYLRDEIAAAKHGGPTWSRLTKEFRDRKLQSLYDTYRVEADKRYESLDRVCKWRLPCEAGEAMILAGNVLYAGGKGSVIAVSAETGKKLWTAAVDGDARGLAVAAGHLLVSTTKGHIYAFAPRTKTAAPPKRVPPPAVLAPPADIPIARRILKETSIKRGYCLIRTRNATDLAIELARRTQLSIDIIEPDPAKVAPARRILDRGGLYGPRVTIRHGNPRTLSYPPYFANLIISDDSSADLLPLLRPLGGLAYLFKTIIPHAPPATKVRTTPHDDWTRLTRGPLAGAANWTHQYATPGNTFCSEDRRVRGPFGILWFGDPGPKRIIDRHARPPAPLSAAGRLFIQGRGVVMAYDAYNGLPLWQRPIPQAHHHGVPLDSGNLAATADSLFVHTGRQCLRLDAATGKTRRTYALPPRRDGKPRLWAWIATDGRRLYGSRTETDRPFKTWPTVRNNTSECVFALDLAGGDVKWTYAGRGILNNCIAMGDGTVFLLDRRGGGDAKGRLDRKGKPVPRDVREVVAIDAETGKTKWVKTLDLTDCVVGPSAKPQAAGIVTCMYKDNVLLLCSAPLNGHFDKEFRAGRFSRRSIIALAADTGKLIWSGRKGYKMRPIVVGRTIFAEPWAHDLKTGRPLTRKNPLTGKPSPLDFWRGYSGCSDLAASAHTIFGRARGMGYFDIDADRGFVPFGTMRYACSINAISANGLVLIPEGSSGCACAFGIKCSLALYPRRTDRSWSFFSPNPLTPTPVTHLALNLGAPGDRRDASGKLWLAWPRRGQASALDKWAPYYGPRDDFYWHRTDSLRIAGATRPWLFTSGYRGRKPLTFRLLAKGDRPAAYTVRLGFALPDATGRVFDVFLQGRRVLESLTPTRRAVVKEFKRVKVTDLLQVKLAPSGTAKATRPVLCYIEAVKE